MDGPSAPPLCASSINSLPLITNINKLNERITRNQNTRYPTTYHVVKEYLALDIRSEVTIPVQIQVYVMEN